MFSSAISGVGRRSGRQWLYQVLKLALTVTSALMIWKSLIVLTSCKSPIIVVLSGSMEPAFRRGDLLFVTNYQDEPILAGDTVVFTVVNHDIPILHRVVSLHRDRDGTVKLLTKGDNNLVDDRSLYPPGAVWLSKEHVLGRARGYLPYLGLFTIYANEYAKINYTVSILVGVYLVLKRD